MTDANPFDENIVGPDGKICRIDRRTVYARAFMQVLMRPDGIETLDWELADTALTLSELEHTRADAPPTERLYRGFQDDYCGQCGGPCLRRPRHGESWA